MCILNSHVSFFMIYCASTITFDILGWESFIPAQCKCVWLPANNFSHQKLKVEWEWALKEGPHGYLLLYRGQLPFPGGKTVAEEPAAFWRSHWWHLQGINISKQVSLPQQTLHWQHDVIHSLLQQNVPAVLQASSVELGSSGTELLMKWRGQFWHWVEERGVTKTSQMLHPRERAGPQHPRKCRLASLLCLCGGGRRNGQLCPCSHLEFHQGLLDTQMIAARKFIKVR